jgi:predicted GNAT family N-acyltransferase
MPPEITCRRAAVAEILPLRHRILRAGLPFETARFDGDDDAGTRHYAAVSGGDLVACLSLMPSEWEGRPAWQLRGMASDSAEQGRGLGRRLFEMAVAEAAGDHPDRGFWCNARTSAVGFYEKLGWRVVSEPFDVPTAGPHVKMVWQAATGSRSAAGERSRVPEPPSAARPPVAAFIIAELVFLAAAHFLGGTAWVALGVLAMIGQVAADFRLTPLLGLLPAAFWMAAQAITGNRELFFPYAMALAAHLAGQFAGRAGQRSVGRGQVAAAAAGGLMVAAFLAIRVIQAATARVLAVEAAVAVGILAACVAALPAATSRRWGSVAIAAAASLLAYVGLAL